MENFKSLKIPLDNIIQATHTFDIRNRVGHGGFGSVYKGDLAWNGDITTVAVKRLNPATGQGDKEFWVEISMLSTYKHKNLVSLFGFCDENKEKILVYVYESRESLDKYIRNPDLTWIQRLKISIGAASGLNYLHNDIGQNYRLLHFDIKSANILLNDVWEAKISDFGLSRISPAHVQHSTVFTIVRGTPGYVDPVYTVSTSASSKSDVYSFGVVLFELLCGRLTYDGDHFLGPLARNHYEQNKLDMIINPHLRKQMGQNSLNTFSAIAYQCVSNIQTERPTMAEVLGELQKALEFQAWNGNPQHGLARVGMLGTGSPADPENRWYLQLRVNEHLKKIIIDHGDLIYSLNFITEFNGIEKLWERSGGWNGGDTVTEAIFDPDEEILTIKGTVGVTDDGGIVISSLTFITNKNTHGHYGRETGTPFTVPCNKGAFAGFYGLASNYIYGFGVYLRATK